jgi:hypothetical protein
MSDKNITKFEDLSDDVLFEVFEYFHGEVLFETFYNLKHRINNILNDSRLLMHIAFARISFMQSLYNLNEIRIVNVALSHSNTPLIAADLQNSSVMPNACQLSIDEVFLPDLIVGLSYIKSRMPNLIHVSIKTYHQSSIPTNNNLVFIIEHLLDLPHIRILSLNITYNSKGTVYTYLSGAKSAPFLERLSIIGCHFALQSILDLIKNSPRLHSIQMKIQRNNERPDYSVLQQLTRATLKLIGFDDINLQKFFRSMTNIVSLRLDDETLVSMARLYISNTARIVQIPIGYITDL